MLLLKTFCLPQMPRSSARQVRVTVVLKQIARTLIRAIHYKIKSIRSYQILTLKLSALNIGEFGLILNAV